ncbi:hypothetical protein ACFZAD_14725 [Streptomyces iakyrus]|uniref:hypothetical protein n=1 Tax=Streptomyces iakyrus TaxID=68219 RepID=UPI0036EA14E5
MSWSAALPGAALRTLRTAAGRHALQVALLVGGLLVIGLVWGEQAHAENGVSGVGGVGVRPEGRAGEAGVERQGPVDALVERSLSPSSSLPEPVSHQAVPGLPAVSDHPGSHGSRGRPDAPALPTLPGLPTLPTLPGLPTLPTLPGLPDSPALPDLPELSALPGLPDLPPPPGDPDVELPGAPAPPDPPDPAAPPTPVTAQPGGASVPDSGTVPADEADSSRHAGKPHTPVVGHEPHGAHLAPAGPKPHGIHATHLRPARPLGHADRFSRPHRLSHPGHPGSSPPAGRRTPAAAGHSPGGRPDGVLGNRSVADSGSSRHGETHAVTPSPWAPLALGSGAGAGASPAGTGCGHRDIPLFPG